MLRSLAALVVLVVACADARVKEPAPARAAAQPAAPAAASTEPTTAEAQPAAPALVVDVDDRSCAGDGDCTAILTECSMCEGACTGVRVDRAARYDGELDCSAHRGAVCNYDCRPRFEIEAPRCVAGRCESVRVR